MKNTLINRRLNLGLTQKQVAKQMGMAASQLSLIETKGNPTEKTLLRYSKALDVLESIPIITVSHD